MKPFTQEDHQLSATFVACMDDRSPTCRPLTLGDPREGGGEVADTQKQAAGTLLVAMVRKLGWIPPSEQVKETLDTPT